VSSSDWKDTDESFDVVALHASELHAAVKAIKIEPKVLCDLSREKMKHVAECMGVPLPFLPARGEDEAKLFVHLVLVMGEAFDADHMALEWCKHVDGKTIFPKLPVCLRAHFDRHLRNRRVKDAVSVMKSDIELLEELNKELVPEELIEPDQESAAGDFASVHDVAAPAESNAATGWPQIPLPPIMPQPQGKARWPVGGLGPPIVAGATVGLVMAPDAPLPGKAKATCSSRCRQQTAS
jgi:hypothetical protein